MEQPKLQEWVPGCYSLKYPATVVAADAMIYRRHHSGDFDILVGRRGPGRWAAGMPLLTFGGFIDPTDESPWHTVARELREELGEQMVMEIPPVPFMISGPVRYCHVWDAEKSQAISTGILMQDIPVIVLTYLSECKRGEPEPTEEVPSAEWWSFRKLLAETREYAFDGARVLAAFRKLCHNL
ncbi:NUDIX domain-containing protein [Patescibacteria group bacterium]|nr:MAG: NUDIX domain-containing protein [Patescibacteria group bacterium]